MNYAAIRHRIRACNYLVVAQLFLQDNFLLERPLRPEDIKPRLLGHWGTCPGLNLAYANLKAAFAAPDAHSDTFAASNPSRAFATDENFSIVIGPGHGFPALQANLFLDGDLLKVDDKATCNLDGLAYICHNFSWPGGFPSHASPVTPGVICEGGELGYALATAYGYALGHPERIVATIIGDGEFETATALASLNLVKLLGTSRNGRVLPVLHLNGYKISAPTISARKSERELNELLRGFGFVPLLVTSTDPEAFQEALTASQGLFAQRLHPFIVMKTPKGFSGPAHVSGEKIAGNFRSHQIPLPLAKTDESQLRLLESWLRSYRFDELFDKEKGFML